MIRLMLAKGLTPAQVEELKHNDHPIGWADRTGGAPFGTEPLWWLTKDGDLSVRDLYRRHYSSRKSKRTSDLVVGPGDKIVLRTIGGDAAFSWRYSKYRRDGQEGVECNLFRNEGPHLSSLLVRQADAIADFVWPGMRHYTFVDAEAIRSTNPGACFRYAGWTRCGTTQRGLIILERVTA